MYPGGVEGESACERDGTSSQDCESIKSTRISRAVQRVDMGHGALSSRDGI